MQWFNDLTFGENRVVQIGLLAAFGIAALVVLAMIYRLVFAQRLRVPAGRTRQPRLGLVDAFSLDGQRQLVLVRRDNVEHLIMIGGPNDVLVESQISRSFAAARENNAAAQPAPARRAEPAPPSAPPPEPAPAKAPAPAAAPAAAPRPAAAAASVKAPAVAPEPKQAPAPAGAAAPPLAAAVKSAPQPETLKTAAPVTSASQPKLAPAGRAMPPPITPPGRANLTPAFVSPPDKAASAQPVEHEKVPPAPSHSDKALSAPAATSVSPAAQPDKMKLAPPPEKQRSAPAPGQPEAAAATKPIKPDSPSPRPESDQHASAAAVEVSATMASPAAHAPSIAEAQMKPMQPIEPPSPEKPAAGAHSPSSQKSAAEDPFAGLDSLEAEMARLLGREKLN